MLISLINDDRIENKVLRGNEVSTEFTVDTLAELAYVSTQSHIVTATFYGGIKDAKHFTQSEVVLFDYDNAEATMEELDECLKDYNYCVLTTQSNMKWKKDAEPCARFRLFVPLSSPVCNLESFQATYDEIEKIIIPPDDRCMRSGVQYAAKHVQVIAFEDQRNNFNPCTKPKQEQQIQTECNVGQYESFLLECSRTSGLYKECSIMLRTIGQRHNGVVKLAFALKRDGISELVALEEIYSLIDKSNNNLHHIKQTVNGIYKRA